MPAQTWTESLGNLMQSGRRLFSHVWEWEARFKGVHCGSRCWLYGRPIISVARNSRLRLGDDVCLTSSVRSTTLGNAQPCVLRTLAPAADLILANRVGASSAVICAAKSIHIGEGCYLGAGVLIIDTDFHHPTGEFDWGTDPLRGARPVVIGRGVFIGARAIVLKGVTIGDRAVIGAGAVVTRDVPAGHIAVGNPVQIKPLPPASDQGL